MKKLIALLLALLALSILFLYACNPGGKDESDPGKTGTSGTGETPGATENPYVTVNEDGTVTYNITAPVFDWGGKKFSILVRGDGGEYADVDFSYSEAKEGEPVNDAAHRRAIEIEEMYNIKINTIRSPRDQHVTQIRNSVQAGDNAYDITFNHPRANGPLSREGALYNLLDFPNINTDEPWWDNNIIEMSSIAGKSYQLAGDISIAYKKCVSVLFFNKQMVSDLGLESPYKLVEDNKWTFETVIGMCKAVWGLNGEANPSSTSIVGMTGQNGTLSQALSACYVRMCAKNDDDIPYVDFYNEHTLDAFEMVTDFFYDRTLFFNFHAGYAGGRSGTQKFQNNETLFFWNEFFQVTNLRAMDTDFGILPAPKYNAEQPRYYHHSNAAESPLLAIPVGKSDEDKEKIGAVVSALAVLGKNYITPAYYDVSLKGKITRDEESEAMIDLVFASMYYDIGRVFDIGGLSSGMSNVHSALNRDIASYYKARENLMESDLSKMVDDYMKLD